MHFSFPAYCSVKAGLWLSEQDFACDLSDELWKTRTEVHWAIPLPQPPSPPKPCSLPPSHPPFPTALPQLFWNTIGYWFMGMCVSTFSSVSIHLYIFYLTRLMKEYLTAVSSILTSKEWVLGIGQTCEILFGKSLKRPPRSKMKSSNVNLSFFFYLSVRFLLPICHHYGHLMHMPLIPWNKMLLPMLHDCLPVQWTLAHLGNWARSLCVPVSNAYPFSLQLRACTMPSAANEGEETVLQNKPIGLSSL